MTLGATHLTPGTALTLFSLRPWIVAVAAQGIERQNAVDQHLYRLEASRDPLSATLVVFNLVAILLTTLMAVVTVGRAILNKELGFANVIWLRRRSFEDDASAAATTAQELESHHV